MRCQSLPELTAIFVVLTCLAGILLYAPAANAQVRDNAENKDREMTYGKALFLNMCSQDYYNYFNPGDKLSSKARQQMVSHIRASCQCLYNNLEDVFSENDILSYVQSRHVSRDTALREYGNISDQVYEMMTSEELREECRHLYDMGASYDDES